jgi:hypothetical protein
VGHVDGSGMQEDEVPRYVPKGIKRQPGRLEKIADKLSNCRKHVDIINQ